MHRYSSLKTHPYKRISGWQKSALFALGSLALVTVNKTLHADDSHDISEQRFGTGSLQRGKEKSDTGRCQECHGINGISTDPKIPNHAGQYANYLAKQLRDFQSGARVHAVMSIMAEDLSTEDIADISTYFANQTPMQGDANGNTELANKLFTQGDQGRDIPACNTCHGNNGKGNTSGNITYPLIGGQRSIYLRSQLMNWKLDDRHNSPESVMNKIGHLLSEDEINALANYASGL